MSSADRQRDGRSSWTDAPRRRHQYPSAIDCMPREESNLPCACVPVGHVQAIPFRLAPSNALLSSHYERRFCGISMRQKPISKDFADESDPSLRRRRRFPTSPSLTCALPADNGVDRRTIGLKRHQPTKSALPGRLSATRASARRRSALRKRKLAQFSAFREACQHKFSQEADSSTNNSHFGTERCPAGSSSFDGAWSRQKIASVPVTLRNDRRSNMITRQRLDRGSWRSAQRSPQGKVGRSDSS